jgi:hypothetical protein
MRVERLFELSAILEVALESLLAADGQIAMSHCENSQAIRTINGNPAFENDSQKRLVDYLTNDNMSLTEQNNTLIEMLKKYLK